MSDSLGPHGLYPARLCCPWNFPGKNKTVGVLFPTPGDLPDLGVEPRSLAPPALADRFFTTAPPRKPLHHVQMEIKMSPTLWTSLVAQTVKCLPTIRETQLQSLGWEDLLEKEMATHSSTLAWKIPWMEKPGRLQSMGSWRVGHDWATSFIHSLTQHKHVGNKHSVLLVSVQTHAMVQSATGPPERAQAPCSSKRMQTVGWSWKVLKQRFQFSAADLWIPLLCCSSSPLRAVLPPGHMWPRLEMFCWSQSGRGETTGIQWLEARDAAEHLQSAGQSLTGKDHLARDVMIASRLRSYCGLNGFMVISIQCSYIRYHGDFLEKEMTTRSSIFAENSYGQRSLAGYLTVHGVAKSWTQLNDWAHTGGLIILKHV